MDDSPFLCACHYSKCSNGFPATENGLCLSGGMLVIQGTNNNGTSPGTYRILTATNAAVPGSSWVLLTNGSFDKDGSFTTTNAAGLDSQTYYRLEVP
jgi:hypothetical protein